MSTLENVLKKATQINIVDDRADAIGTPYERFDRFDEEWDLLLKILRTASKTSYKIEEDFYGAPLITISNLDKMTLHRWLCKLTDDNYEAKPFVSKLIGNYHNGAITFF